MRKKKVALLMGGKSSERAVSLNSGHEVLKHLDSSRYEATVFDPATDLFELHQKVEIFDLAFLALHGPFGEDGTMQGFCRMLGLPFTGSDVMASAVAMNKAATKKVYQAAKLPIAKDLVFKAAEVVGREEAVARQIILELGSTVVLKPIHQGSSVGLSITKDYDSLVLALKDVFNFDEEVLFEQYLMGKEYTCAVLGDRYPEALPPIEILPAPGHSFFDYEAKYSPGEAQEICPAPLSPQETANISQLALAAHQALGCQGISRTDFILCDDIFYLLETNTLPGLTTGSLVPKAAQAYGLSFGRLLTYLIEVALDPTLKLSDFK